MTKITHLREKLRKNTSLRECVKKRCSIDESALKSKLYNPKRFTIGEMIIIKNVLALTMDETIKIFAPMVAKCN